ncbi:MAG: helix-turn-helix domain-containing protein [Candidatus Nanopelagicales bacterium]|nr:helix-turn-helix domain-containing protein [Candidatus Nanopelagicales bacterium]
MTAVDAATDIELRGQLSRLNALLVLSMLMTESTDEQQIIRLGASAAPSFAACRLVGVFTHDGETTVWTPGDDEIATPPAILDLPTDGGAVEITGSTWAWAYSLGGISTSLGHMVVAASHEIDRDGHFLLRVLAQQIGTAIRNSRLHQFERTAAAELASVNSQLESTVQALAQRIEIHDRLTLATVSGEGMEGIANAVHEVTGLPVIIEDRFGNLRAWAGPGDPPNFSKDPPARREQLLRRLLRESQSTWESGRVMRAASPRPDSVGVIALIDPDRMARNEDLAALEYGATILSMELARLRTVADTEVRVRRDLVEDLLAGTGGEAAVQRGEAFQHDLKLPHRVVVFEGRGRTRDEDQFFTAVRRAARDFGLGSLLVARAGTVVLLTDRDVDWEGVQATVIRELAGGTCRIGVGGLTNGPDDFPTSHREAVLSLNLLCGRAGAHNVVAFEDLGVYRLLASTEDSREIEKFIAQWLGPLLEYDERRHSELVLTLYRYLECGGHYNETAEALLIHRSTLKYRLQRIRDVSQLPIGDADVNFNLQLACRAWSTLKALRSPVRP